MTSDRERPEQLLVALAVAHDVDDVSAAHSASYLPRVAHGVAVVGVAVGDDLERRAQSERGPLEVVVIGPAAQQGAPAAADVRAAAVRGGEEAPTTTTGGAHERDAGRQLEVLDDVAQDDEVGR